MTIEAKPQYAKENIPGDNVCEKERIARIQKKYQTGDSYISIERAKYYTESWMSTEGKGISNILRVALAMKNVYENMTHYLDPDDRIAGYWCEFFLGSPIPIEKGEYNRVLEAELTKRTMLALRSRSLAKGLVYMIRKGKLKEFLHNKKVAGGAPPLNMGLQTMSERTINPYQIRNEDRQILLNELLPYWNGKAVVDRLEREMLNSGLYSKDMHDFIYALPGNTSRQVLMLSTCATASCIQGHVIPDFDKVLRMGLLAMKAEVAEKRNNEKCLNDTEKEFLDSLLVVFDGITIYAKRLAEKIEKTLSVEADVERQKILKKMLLTCKKVPLEPAKTFEEAIQSLWTMKTAIELAHPINLHCFGRLDQALYPYYKKDIEENRITREEALKLLEELLLKDMSQNIRPESNILSHFYHRFLGSTPVTIGGLRPDGEDGTNEVSYLFLEAAHNSKAVTNVSLRVSTKTPDDFLLKLAEHMHEGTSSYSLFNDEINIKAMKRRGFSEDDARDYAVMGCVELTCPGKTGSMSANALLLSRLLDITLRNGASKMLAGTIQDDGLKTGDPDSFKTFDELLDALQAQGKYFIKNLVPCNVYKFG
jgi:formate C-acetyltransferase